MILLAYLPALALLLFAALTPGERRLNGRQGGHASWARTADRAARTAPARAAAMARFEREVDPDGTLPAEERARRAESARRAYFAGLARQSAASRRRKATTS